MSTLFAGRVDARVHGTPVPQGSKISREINGRWIPIDSNSNHLKPWRKAVAAAVREAMGMQPDTLFPLTGPIVVSIETLLHQAPSNRDPYPTGKNTGDGDKLTRAIFDALTASGVIVDDCQITDHYHRKRWATPSRPPGAYIRIEPLGEQA